MTLIMPRFSSKNGLVKGVIFDEWECQTEPFFHFRWNSLRAGHVSIRAQEKTSSHFFITKNTCHAHSRPFQAKHAQKMSGKKLP